MRALWPRLLVLTLLFGCPLGSTSSGYQPAKGPAGADVTLDLGGKRTVRGELLAVEEDALLVLQKGRLVRVAISSLHQTRAPKVSHSGSDLPAEVRERLRLISRYPQGVAGELETRLLQAYGQPTVDEMS